MKTKHLLILLVVVGLALSFGACKKKEAPAPTVAEPTPTPVSEPEVAVPTEAGAKPVETPVDVAKVQVIDGLTYTISVIGWDNPFAVTVCVKVLDNIKILSAAAQGEEKDVLAKAEVDITGVKGKLEAAIKDKKPLTQEELKALKDTLNGTRAALKDLYRPNLILTEAQGDKLKEGYRLKEEKLKEGGDLRKEKYKEGGDMKKEKSSEGK